MNSRIIRETRLDLASTAAKFEPIPAVTVVHGGGRGPLSLSSGEIMWALERACRRTSIGPDPWRCWEWDGYTRNGYGAISIRNSPVYLHALSSALSCGPISGGNEVRHRCDNRPCWRPEHLVRGTRLENVRDMWERGRAVAPPRTPGMAQHLATLTDDDVAEIRAAWDRGDVDQHTLAAAFGCSQSTVWRLVHRKVRA